MVGGTKKRWKKYDCVVGKEEKLKSKNKFDTKNILHYSELWISV